jgi:hypothetical protein
MSISDYANYIITKLRRTAKIIATFLGDSPQYKELITGTFTECILRRTAASYIENKGATTRPDRADQHAVLSRTRACVGAAFFDDAFLDAVQSRHADSSIRTNACPSGLCAPSIPKLSGSTTGASQPSIVKCGVFANSLDAEDVGPGGDPVEEDVGVADEADEGVVGR